MYSESTLTNPIRKGPDPVGPEAQRRPAADAGELADDLGQPLGGIGEARRST